MSTRSRTTEVPTSLSSHGAQGIGAALSDTAGSSNTEASSDTAALSSTAWTELLPWLRGYRSGPSILDDSELIPNSWIGRSPRDTLSDRNSTEFRARVATRFVMDLADQPLESAFPAVPARLPMSALTMPARVRSTLQQGDITTTRDLLRCTVESLVQLRGAGRATAVDIVTALIRASEAPRHEPPPTPADASSAIGEVESFVASCTDREVTVLRTRVLADARTTLDDVGAVLGISRERVNRIDNKIRERLSTDLLTRPHLSELSDQLVRLADPVASHERVAHAVPDIDTFVPTLGLPLRAVLSAIDDRFEFADGWLIKETSDFGLRCLSAAVAAQATTEGLSSVYAVADELNMPGAELVRYAEAAGYREFDGHLVAGNSSVPGHIASALALAGQPLTMDQLVDRIRPRRSESAIRNSLVGDDRFVKSDRSSWALRRWGITPYVPIHRQIAAIVDARGRVGIDRLVSEITALYDVKEFSIRTYASTGEFVTVDDVVSRRTRRYTPRKSAAKTKHLYRAGDVVRWRTTVAAVHWKGSAFNLPSALAALLDVGPGSPREFASRLGPQSVLWVSVQARSGTIKRFLADMELEIGDDIFLEFGQDGTFDVVAVPDASDDPIRATLSAVGYPLGRRTPSVKAAVRFLADALWLPESTGRAVVDALTARRETALAELTRAWAL